MIFAHQYIGLDSGLAQWHPPGGGSALTSVGLAVPAPFTVIGSPLESNGTMTMALVPQSAASVWAAPQLASGVPSFRLLAASDIPPLDAAKVITGVFSTSRLGTGTANSTTYLRGDGAWASVPMLPGGLPSQVQYNAGGVFGGSASLTFNAPTAQLALTSSTSGSAFTVTASGAATTAITATRVAGSAPAIAVTGAAQTGTGLVAVTVTTPGTPLAAYMGHSDSYGTAAVAGIALTGGLIGVLAGVSSAGTAIPEYPFVVRHETTNAAFVAAGFGAGVLFRLQTSVAVPVAGAYHVAWQDATDATRSSYHAWMTVSSGGALTERMRLSADGTFRLGTSIAYAALKPSGAGTPTFVLPGTVGTSGQMLTTDGTGVLSWQMPPGGYVDPMTSIGDILFRNASNVSARLPVGAGGQILRVASGLPSWQTLTLYSDPLSADGDLLVRQGGTTTRLPIGIDGDVLTVAVGIPSWQTPPVMYIDPMTTAGDTLYRNASNVSARLSIGADGQFYRVVSGLPAWQTVVLFEDPLLNDGDLLVRQGGTTTRLPIGIDGDVLTVAVGIPSWQTPPAMYIDPMTTVGDTLYRNASNVSARLPIGADGQFYRVVSGLPAWQSVVLYQDPLLANGDILTRTAGVTTRLPVGTSGQFLRVVGSLPVWQTVNLYVNPLATDGDILYHNTITTRLPVGTSGQFLRVVGGLPAWQTVAVYLDPLSTNGDMAVRSGGITTRLPVGTNGQQLTVVSGAPSWQTPPAPYVDPLVNNGDIVVRSGGTTTRLPIGSNGQLLTVVGAAVAWQTLVTYVDPMTSGGDLVHRSALNITSRLPIGTSGQFLRVASSLPVWQTVVLYTDPLTSNGDLLTRSGGTTTRLPVGSNGQQLVVAAGLPSWQTPPILYVDPMTSIGDVVYRDAGNTTARLPIGTSGQFFRVAGGLPVWQTVVLYTDPLLVDGDILIRQGGITTRLPIGVNGQILKIVSGSPSWQNP